MSAVVFAYHSVGVRCLSVLLEHGINVKLVVTHSDSSDENIWFGSVANLAAQHDIPVVAPENPHDEETMKLLHAAEPDFLFSFYYRMLLKSSILKIPKRGCYNMHGSLLPLYRGRVPVNWAVLHGETQTGATLHAMIPKADAGAIVCQMTVPILRNDTSKDVFDKVLVASELVLHRSVPLLLAGTAQHTAMDLSRGSYFSGRSPKDGRIDWGQSALQIHNLVRAVTHPYPGAFAETIKGRMVLWRTILCKELKEMPEGPVLFMNNEKMYLRARDGSVLRVLEVEIDGETVSAIEDTIPLDAI
jgi:methionyl-tRNA formyltransferase